MIKFVLIIIISTSQGASITTLPDFLSLEECRNAGAIIADSYSSITTYCVARREP